MSINRNPLCIEIGSADALNIVDPFRYQDDRTIETM